MATFANLQREGVELTLQEVEQKLSSILRPYKLGLKETRSLISSFYSKNLSGVNPKDYFTEAIKFNRLSKLEKDISEIYREQSKESGKGIVNAGKVAMSNNYYRQQYATNWQSEYPTTELPKEIVSVSVLSNKNKLNEVPRRYRDLVSWLISQSGRSLSGTLTKNRNDELEKIIQVVNNGLQRGVSYTEMSKDITDRFNKSASKARTVVRTEAHRLVNGGQWMQWLQAEESGVEGERQLQAVLDNRTRPQSASMDGQIENEEGLFTYPNGAKAPFPGSSGVAAYDINDREYVIYLIDGKSPQLRRGRNPATGKTEVMTYRSFNQWANENGLKKNKFGQIVA